MPRIGLALLLWITSLAVGPALAQTRHAILVGVSRYVDVPGVDLRGPANDVPLIRTLLVDTLGYDPQRIAVLADGVDDAVLPTRGAIMTAFAKLLRQVRETPGPHEVFIYFAGHGARQPADPADVPRRSLDGFDAIFLPRDTGPWSEEGGVRNAILNKELRQLVDDLMRADAFVWFMADSCHAGYGLRDGTTRPRLVPAVALGIPDRPLRSAAAVTDAMRARGAYDRPWLSFDAATSARLGWVAFFASRPDQLALEMDLPAGSGSGERKAYGLFTRQVFRAIQANPSASFRQVAQEVLRSQSAAFSVTPVFAGSGLDRAVGSASAPQVLQWTVKRDGDGRIVIPAGTLHEVGEGTLLGLWRSAVDRSDDLLVGYANVVRAGPLESELVPIAVNGGAVLAPSALVGTSASVVVPAVPLSLVIARPPPGPVTPEPDEQRARDLLAQFDRQDRTRGDFRWVNSEDEAQVRTFIRDGMLWFLPEGAAPNADGEPQGPRLSLDHLSEAALDRVLARLFKSTNLGRFAQQQNAGPLRRQLISELRNRDCLDAVGTGRLAGRDQAPTVSEGDCLDLTLVNTSDWDLCATALYKASDGGMSLLWPRRDGESNLLARRSRILVDTVAVNLETTGPENIVVLTAALERGQDCVASGYDFGFLAESPLQETRRGPAATSFSSFADRFASTRTRGGARGGESRVPPLLVRFEPIEVLSKDRIMKLRAR